MNGFADTITNGNLIASNGLFSPIPDALPTQSWNKSNYYRDVLFTPQ